MALFAIMRDMTRTKIFDGLGRSLAPKASSLVKPLALSLLCSGLLLGATAERAEAKLLEVYGDIYAGGMYGTEPRKVSVITQRSEAGNQLVGADFYRDNSGGLVGGRVGVELFFTDLYLQFDQMITPRGLSASTLQAMLGWDTELGSGKWRGTIGAYGGLVVGFPYTPHTTPVSSANPNTFIDTKQISNIGLLGEGQAGVEYKLSPFLAAQFVGTVGYHWMFGGADPVLVDSAGNTEKTVTHGFHLMAKFGLRFSLGI
jgi:hypothetical protein